MQVKHLSGDVVLHLEQLVAIHFSHILDVVFAKNPTPQSVSFTHAYVLIEIVLSVIEDVIELVELFVEEAMVRNYKYKLF